MADEEVVPIRTKDDPNSSIDFNTVQNQIRGTFPFPAGSFRLPPVDPANYVEETKSGVTLAYHTFHPTTEKFVEGQFTLPASLPDAGKIRTVIWLFLKFPSGSPRNVRFKNYWGHNDGAGSTDWDVPFADEFLSNDFSVLGIGDEDLFRIVYDQSYTGYGWENSNFMNFRFSKVVASSDNYNDNVFIASVDFLILDTT